MVSDSEGHSYLLLGNLHRIPENRPEHCGVTRRCGQGPFVAVVLIRPLRKQLFDAETRNEHCLAWGHMVGKRCQPFSPWQRAAGPRTEPRI